jgi:hypothetical protein
VLVLKANQSRIRGGSTRAQYQQRYGMGNSKEELRVARKVSRHMRVEMNQQQRR